MLGLVVWLDTKRVQSNDQLMQFFLNLWLQLSVYTYTHRMAAAKSRLLNTLSFVSWNTAIRGCTTLHEMWNSGFYASVISNGQHPR